jgi:hypothetical protein
MLSTSYRGEFHNEIARSTMSFAIADPDGPMGRYELIVDFSEGPTDLPPATVIRARLAYVSPGGWRFFAEDTKQHLEVGKEAANQSREATATAGMSPAAQPPRQP